MPATYRAGKRINHLVNGIKKKSFNIMFHSVGSCWVWAGWMRGEPEQFKRAKVKSKHVLFELSVIKLSSPLLCIHYSVTLVGPDLFIIIFNVSLWRQPYWWIHWLPVVGMIMMTPKGCGKFKWDSWFFEKLGYVRDSCHNLITLWLFQIASVVGRFHKVDVISDKNFIRKITNLRFSTTSQRQVLSHSSFRSSM